MKVVSCGPATLERPGPWHRRFWLRRGLTVAPSPPPSVSDREEVKVNAASIGPVEGGA